MATKKKMLQAAAGAAGGEALAIEDVFSTYLYTGTGSALTITNGIDLAGEGGLVWIKDRDQARENVLQDTERGTGVWISSNLVNGNLTNSQYLTQFNSDGFGVGTESDVNFSGENYASWTFRKAPRFFDVVTYTGTGSARTVSHNLGLVPGCIIIKSTSSTTNWPVYHRGTDSSFPERYALALNETDGRDNQSSYFNNTAPTDSVFTVNTDSRTNASGQTYVAYLFAHDPFGPSGDGSDGLIACGSYPGNSSTDGPEIYLGWEPQWLLIKRSDFYGTDWNLIDSMRGLTVGGSDAELNPNLSSAESTGTFVSPNATGFQLNTTDAAYNASGGTYIYIAIRRGPMRQPTSGTEVFYTEKNTTSSPTFTTGFPIDTYIYKATSFTQDWFLQTRLTNSVLKTNLTNAEDTSFLPWDSNTQMSTGLGADYANYFFRRAPGFFDVVAYTGNGVAGRTVPHNLGVAPELIIARPRNLVTSWPVYSSALTGSTPPYRSALRLNESAGERINETYWSNYPDASNFYVDVNGGDAAVNSASGTYIAYLFATLPGVSKVGSYTGDGTNDGSKIIDCGFSGGARFVLIKSTSSGNWWVFDTERGIVSGNDAVLWLNNTDAEFLQDAIDPHSSGFIVNGNINYSGETFIFLAIA